MSTYTIRDQDIKINIKVAWYQCSQCGQNDPQAFRVQRGSKWGAKVCLSLCILGSRLLCKYIIIIKVVIITGESRMIFVFGVQLGGAKG